MGQISVRCVRVTEAFLGHLWPLPDEQSMVAYHVFQTYYASEKCNHKRLHCRGEIRCVTVEEHIIINMHMKYWDDRSMQDVWWTDTVHTSTHDQAYDFPSFTKFQNTLTFHSSHYIQPWSLQ